MRRSIAKFWLRGAAVCAAASLLLGPVAAQDGREDYPTVAIADYVFGCMGSNGQTREALEKCSCSIDVIASLLPYDAFVEAETVARMRQVGGEKGSLFRTGVEPKEAFARMKRAQAEAEVRCF
ncbi:MULTISPECIES: hypothetical protein [Rhodomicrobium]|uniref:hypothetical protein n=1 Tax=Rhodomicrobium TaxID=1068 RepID=UPI001482D92F|nr:MULTISPECIES: hypothetical protein [Rhodomicrobium]